MFEVCTTWVSNDPEPKKIHKILTTTVTRSDHTWYGLEWLYPHDTHSVRSKTSKPVRVNTVTRHHIKTTDWQVLVRGYSLFYSRLGNNSTSCSSLVIFQEHWSHGITELAICWKHHFQIKSACTSVDPNILSSTVRTGCMSCGVFVMEGDVDATAGFTSSNVPPADQRIVRELWHL